jgi:nucleoside-diphosphate-sugar epimerase
MKKILITGGAGFIGFHLSKKFLKEGYKVDIVDNLKRGIIDFDLKNILTNQNINFINSNLLKVNLNNWSNDYDKIFHLAAIIGVKHVKKNPYNVLTQNVNLLDNVIKIALKQKKLSKFIFFSTSEVYAGTLKSYGLKFPTPENTKLTVSDLFSDRTSYMMSKIYGELMCNLNKNLPHVNIRPHNFYGPRMGFSHVIPELMKKIYFSKNGKVKISSPNHRRSFCYISDAVDLIYKMSISKRTKKNTYNIGSTDKSISIMQLAKKIKKILNRNTTLVRSTTEIGSPVNRRADMKKIKKIIKFKYKFKLDKGLENTYDWYLNNIFIKNKKTFI